MAQVSLHFVISVYLPPPLSAFSRHRPQWRPTRPITPNDRFKVYVGKDRTPTARLAAHGVTDADFRRVELAAPSRRVKHLSAATEIKHTHLLKLFADAMQYEVDRFQREDRDSYLETCAGNPASIEDMFVEGAPFPSKAQIE